MLECCKIYGFRGLCASFSHHIYIYIYTYIYILFLVEPGLYRANSGLPCLFRRLPISPPCVPFSSETVQVARVQLINYYSIFISLFTWSRRIVQGERNTRVPVAPGASDPFTILCNAECMWRTHSRIQISLCHLYLRACVCVSIYMYIYIYTSIFIHIYADGKWLPEELSERQSNSRGWTCNSVIKLCWEPRSWHVICMIELIDS